jgi:uncharacterized protein YndB with AHSA1/START domain
MRTSTTAMNSSSSPPAAPSSTDRNDGEARTALPAEGKAGEAFPLKIEKQLVLRAPRSRVWRALADADQFGTWFRARLDGPFAAGQRTTGQSTYPGYEHKRFEMWVETMEAEHNNVDYSQEPTTLVEFRLEEAPEGTRLTVVESGFDRLPAGRRAEAFRMNSQGWAKQMEHVQAYVEG